MKSYFATRSARSRVLTLASALLAILMCSTTASAAEPAEVRSIQITVNDVDKVAGFFKDVLSFQTVNERTTPSERTVDLKLGDELVELKHMAGESGRTIPADSRSNDRWFQHIAIITSDMDAAYLRLRQARVRHASSAPQRLPDWNIKAAGIRAFYFRDPEDHVLEILQFPPGKGEARWQRKDGLFLGIEHTAIVVADTDTSVKFYREHFGFNLAGESENWGDEQEHLNGVFGAHLRITTLRGQAGPGVELLEYLSPTDGRPYPTDTKTGDLWNWHTQIIGNQNQAIRDPDGHAIEVVRP